MNALPYAEKKWRPPQQSRRQSDVNCTHNVCELGWKVKLDDWVGRLSAPRGRYRRQRATFDGSLWDAVKTQAQSVRQKRDRWQGVLCHK